MADERDEELNGIQQAAERLGVSARTLRFYEDKGLIRPRRVGNTRVYSGRDLARMGLILRGKQIGLSLRQIDQFLDLYDTDPRPAAQTRTLGERCRQEIDRLERQRDAIQQTLGELRRIERGAGDA